MLRSTPVIDQMEKPRKVNVVIKLVKIKVVGAVGFEDTPYGTQNRPDLLSAYYASRSVKG